jgi:hypothetical protein
MESDKLKNMAKKVVLKKEKSDDKDKPLIEQINWKKGAMERLKKNKGSK